MPRDPTTTTNRHQEQATMVALGLFDDAGRGQHIAPTYGDAHGFLVGIGVLGGLFWQGDSTQRGYTTLILNPTHP